VSLSRTLTIRHNAGIHARPAGKIVRLMRTFDATVTLFFNDKSASTHSVLEMMLLGIQGGDAVMMTATGNDEKAALDALTQLIEDSFQGHL